MAITDALGRRDQALADNHNAKRLAATLVIAALTFNAVLSFVNVHVMPITSLYVSGSELVIITIALALCYDLIDVKFALLIVFYTLFLACARGLVTPDEGMNVKIIRDFLIPIVFFLLGKKINDIDLADRIVSIATIVVLIFAIFEYFFLDSYLKLFGVLEYYIARGTLDPYNPSLEWTNGLMGNGTRPPEQGRALLSFLGEHRVSSLFLESISLGNFGSLVAFWGIVRWRMESRQRIWLIVAGIAFIILSDSRFNAYFMPIGVLMLLFNPRVTTPLALSLPFIAMLGLYAVAANSPIQDSPFLEGLSLPDRLLFSGRILLDLDITNLLGIGLSPASTLDTGYAYVITSFGFLGFLGFWLWFMSLRGRNPYFYAFRNAIAAYFAALLCISASQFTIKTAAMLWFVMGTLSIASGQKNLSRQPAGQPIYRAS